MAQRTLLRCCILAALLLSRLVQSRSASRLRRREMVALKGSGPCPPASRHPNPPEQGRAMKRGLCKAPEPRGVLRVRARRGRLLRGCSCTVSPLVLCPTATTHPQVYHDNSVDARLYSARLQCGTNKLRLNLQLPKNSTFLALVSFFPITAHL